MEKKKKPFYKRVWFIVLAVVVIIGGIASIGDDEEPTEPTNTSNESSTNNEESNESNDDSSESEGESEKSETESEEVDPIEVTVDELMKALNDNALKAANTYKDKYVKLTGELSTIDAQGEYFSLGPINEEYTFDTITCNIEEEHLDQVMEFQDGQNVTVLGTVSDVGEILGYTVEVESIE